MFREIEQKCAELNVRAFAHCGFPFDLFFAAAHRAVRLWPASEKKSAASHVWRQRSPLPSWLKRRRCSSSHSSSHGRVACFRMEAVT